MGIDAEGRGALLFYVLYLRTNVNKSFIFGREDLLVYSPEG